MYTPHLKCSSPPLLIYLSISPLPLPRSHYQDLLVIQPVIDVVITMVITKVITKLANDSLVMSRFMADRVRARRCPRGRRANICAREGVTHAARIVLRLENDAPTSPHLLYKRAQAMTARPPSKARKQFRRITHAHLWLRRSHRSAALHGRARSILVAYRSAASAAPLAPPFSLPCSLRAPPREGIPLAQHNTSFGMR